MASSSYHQKRSISDEGRLYMKRGLCPNRFELLNKLFRAKKFWAMSFVYIKEATEKTEFHKLKFLYVSESKKLFFIPTHDEPRPDEKEVHGYFLTTQRADQDGSELIKERLKLYMITPEDMKKYMPRLSPELIKQLTKNHKISQNSERLIRANWDGLIEEKEKNGEFTYFYSEGFSRLNYQTTGSVFGHWE